tara:strand:+ start:593 stop:2149 length:1557 start_codon:yes stop_codon:yes gene_type:complete
MNQTNINQLLHNALSLHHQGDLDNADKIYIQILEMDKDNFMANHLHGCVLSQNKNYEDAIIYLERSVILDNNNYEANNNLGIAYKNLQNHVKSENCFKKAIDINSMDTRAYFNYANLEADLSKFSEAIVLLKKVINIDGNHLQGYQRLGEVYQYKFRQDRNINHLNDSIDYFNKALSINPSSIESNITLAMSHLWLNNIDAADNYFKVATTLMHSSEEAITMNINNYYGNNVLLTSLIKHEFEQLTHIDQDSDDIRNHKFTKEYYDSLKKLYDKTLTGNLKAEDVTKEMKNKLYKILYNKPPKKYKNNLINKENISEHESEYLDSKPEILIIDNFLTNEALRDIQKFCRNANIFKYPYYGGYVGAFLSKGLANKFILNLSEELRLTYKNIFNDFRLTQAWIFKYDSQKVGTNIHADQAAVNVNFWVSPESANQNKKNGGLMIWDELPPKEWNFDDYNSLDKSPKIKKMLETNNISKRIIPYKENRAVIFNSKLFHATDDFDFENTYINKRVNITFLYD